MIKTMTLTPTLVPALTRLPWHTFVAGQLDDPAMYREILVGVDIGHVKLPGLVVSEACAGFVMRDEGIRVTTVMFAGQERVAFDQVQMAVGASGSPSLMTHSALGAQPPQVNTLVFRRFTLAYSFDFRLPSADLPASFRPRLILHDAAAALPPRDLGRTIQHCVDSFTSAHDNLGGIRLRAPDASVLGPIMAKLPA